MKQKRRAVIQLVLLSAALFASCGKSGETDNTEPNGTEEVWDIETVSDETEIAEQKAEEDPEGTPAEAVLIRRATRHEGDGTTFVAYEEEYDEAGNQIKLIYYEEDGSISSWAEREYDAFGNWTKNTIYEGDGSISLLAVYEYDAAGKKTKSSSYAADVRGSFCLRMWEEYEYDTDGNMIRYTDYYGDGSFYGRHEFEYDVFGNLLTETSYNKDGNISQKSVKAYDSYGNLIMKSWYSYHADGSVSDWYEYEMEYDESGNEIREHCDESGVISLVERTYDMWGNNTKIISYKSDGSIDWWTEKEYDSLGNETLSIRYQEDGSIDWRIEREYDQFGNLIKRVDDGVFIDWDEYEYDELGRQTKHVSYYEDGSIEYWYEYEYLSVGQAPAENLQETDNYIENYNVDRYFLKGSNNSSLYEVTYQIFEGYDTEEMLVDFIIVAELENGMLYKMQIEDLSVERFPVYLYETDEKIYRLWDFGETDIVMEEDELIQNAIVVWQDQEMPDPLSEEEQGEHHYILVEGDKCESHYYQYNDRANVVGYWEAFYWEEGKGLVQYRSGFSALADLVEMTKIE